MARERQRQAGRDRAWRLPPRALVTEQSLRVDLANAKEQVRPLTEEVGLLRKRLTRDLGAHADLARGASTVRSLISWSYVPASSKPRTRHCVHGSQPSRASCTISTRTSRQHRP